MELLVVVCCLLVLAGLLVDFLPSRPSEGGRRVHCAGNLKDIGVAALTYTGDHNGYFMNLNRWGLGCNNTPPTGNWQPLGTDSYSTKSSASFKVWACPSAAQPHNDSRTSNYVYFGSGWRDDWDDATTTVIGFDASGNHTEKPWMNGLFIDGHVEGAMPDGSKRWNRNDALPRRPPPPQQPRPCP